jgi:hypothetical protein
MTVGADKLALSELPEVDSQSVVHFVSGLDAVLRLNRRLMDFSARCGEPGAMHDIAYFLSKPGALPRIPHLLLVGAATMDLSSPSLDDLLGFLLIFEQKVGGLGIGAFATNDRSGRSTLIAMPWHRSHVAALCTRALLERGAHLILMSFRVDAVAESAAAGSAASGPEAPAGVPLLAPPVHGRELARWAQRERTIPGYLPLASTFDATLARIGQRTRSNLRYYRRRAESDLGCRFLAQVEMSREEALAFNRECMYAAPADVVGWRYDSLQDLSEPIFLGMKDRHGQWLSVLGGRRYLDRSEVLWQLNREGYAGHSLGTVMRSYLIENEIAHGSHRLYIEGGTPHPIKFSFVPERITDLAVVRRSQAASLMRWLAKRYISRENELLHMLGESGLDWQPC